MSVGLQKCKNQCNIVLVEFNRHDTQKGRGIHCEMAWFTKQSSSLNFLCETFSCKYSVVL